MKRPRCEVPECRRLAVSVVVTRCEEHEYEATMRAQRARRDDFERRANVVPLPRGKR